MFLDHVEYLGIPPEDPESNERLPNQGGSRFDRFDFDMVRYLAFDIASIFQGPEPVLDRACCYVSVSVSIGSITLRFRSEPPPFGQWGIRKLGSDQGSIKHHFKVTFTHFKVTFCIFFLDSPLFGTVI